ncbi:MAG: DUF2007 domain-containing protein [Prevotellaceae bacterium]|jgi:hypothetical protein|nr:DUF2007 domain-containing protein [Prevotellaceae bacterium]
MSEKTVILKGYETAVEANYELDILKKNDIVAFLDDDLMDLIAPAFSENDGGFRIWVFEGDFEKARKLLEDIA